MTAPARTQPTRRINDSMASPLRSYLRRCNEPSVSAHLRVAAVTGLLARPRGLLGMALRSVAYPRLLAGGDRPVIAHDVVIRGFGRTVLGQGVVLEHGVTLDVKSDRSVALEIGDACTIRTAALLDTGYEGWIRIGRRVAVGACAELRGAGGVVIGDEVLLANGVVIVSAEHRYDDPRVPIADQGLVEGPVQIGAGAWLGAHVVVTGGVTVGAGAIVGANAVVTRDVPPYAIAAGVPARVLRYRDGHDAPPVPTMRQAS